MARKIAPYFDNNHYHAQTNENLARIHPVIHYIRQGAAQGFDPTPDFSTTGYLQCNPDVAGSGVNPFWHFLRFGRDEGRSTTPQVLALPAPENALLAPVETDGFADAVRVISQSFDTEFYRTHANDLPESADELMRHYLTVGWVVGFDPCDWFSTRSYLLLNPDVAIAKINPFLHFLTEGKRENRKIFSPQSVEAEIPNDLDQTADILRPHFDEVFYLKKNADVAEARVDALMHYVSEGFKEGRDPHPEFSSFYYLESNPDVRDAGINPFLHYISAGRDEGRYPKHPGGGKVKKLSKLSTLDKLVNDWQRSDELPALLDAKALFKAIGTRHVDGRLVLAICHDNYQEVSGGVQFCIAREADLATAVGDTYIVVHPWQPLPRLAHAVETPDVAVSLVINGTAIGTTRMDILTDVVASFGETGTKVSVIIHQFLGHSAEQLTALVLATGNKDCILWLHDFLTLCPSYTLQRNDISFCGAPEINSNACSVCFYGKERRDHLARIKKLFESLRVHVLAPSASTKKTWLEKSGLTQASMTVTPHMYLTWSKRSQNLLETDFAELKIAFIGAPAEHKGWSTFVTAAEQHKSDDIQYYYFGQGETTAEDIRQIPVRVSAVDPAAMINALLRENIDFLVHWASWPETFSFTTYEALAAGVFVITNKTSGNVAATVRRTKRGIILDDTDDLKAFLSGADGRLEHLLNVRRKLHAKVAALTKHSMLSYGMLTKKMWT